jgi:hypothetical protein
MIKVDTDWKTEAQAEKKRLEEAEQKTEEGAETTKLPEASFRGLLGILASQALMGLGVQKDPSGKGVLVDLEGSKFTIDLMSMLQDKTKGNLTQEEEAEIKQLIGELQNRFVQIAQSVSSQEEGHVIPDGESEPQNPAGSIIDPTA